jgi:hypothetical protein
MRTEALQPGHRPDVPVKVACTLKRLPHEGQLKFRCSVKRRALLGKQIRDYGL